jgi:hypothetical protein
MQCIGLFQFPSGALSVSPVVVKLCQKLNHELQLLQVGRSQGNLNVDALSLPPDADDGEFDHSSSGGGGGGGDSNSSYGGSGGGGGGGR